MVFENEMSTAPDDDDLDTVINDVTNILGETKNIVRDFDKQTRQAQGDSSQTLGDRVKEINCKKDELNVEIKKMEAESKELDKVIQLADKYLTEIKNFSVKVSKKNLHDLEECTGIDLVNDIVRKRLNEEIDLIKKCQEQIADVINKADGQLNLNQKVKEELERDSHDKFQAEQIDTYAQSLRNLSHGIASYEGVENIDNCKSTPETWLNFTNNNLQRSAAEREASRQLREEIEQILARCQRDMAKQWDDVIEALYQKVQETENACKKIIDNLTKVRQEISNVEKSITGIKKSILDKEDSLNVARTRLNVRLDRPNMEACRDFPKSRLIKEVQEIKESIEGVTLQLQQVESKMPHLLKFQSNLKRDLDVKTNSLFTYRNSCLGARNSFPKPF